MHFILLYVSPFEQTCCILFFLFIAFIVWAIVMPSYEVLSHWHHTFDQSQFSAKEYYEAAQSAIKKREIPNLEFSITTYQETFVFGRSREYLRIERGSYVYDICAAPFGSGYYVSWWFQERRTLLWGIMESIPIIRWFLSVKTFRQIDTEIVFRELVHAGVLEAIDGMTSPNGIRLSEAQRAIPPSKHFTV